MKPERITLVTADLEAGGTQRAVSKMAAYWASVGRAVRVVTLASAEHDFFRLAPTVDRVALDVMGRSTSPWRAITANLRRIRALRHAVLEWSPDAVITFGDSLNCLTLLAMTGTRVPVIVSERSDPRHLPLGGVWSTMRRRLYPRAHAVVVQTDRVAPWARGITDPARVRVIPNFVNVPSRRIDPSSRDHADRQVVALGRLSDEKGFDSLISAFARCASTHQEWSLVIAGEGGSRRALEQLIEANGLTGRARLPGRVEDPERLLVDSDLFVLSSRFEGFPNTLLEAMSVGLPVIAFDCDSGPAEIIRDGIDGVLVAPGDLDGLAGAMDRLMGDEPARLRLGQAAVSVTNRFGADPVMKLWDAAMAAD